MNTIAKELLPVNIEEEMKQSYLAYAMSVIIGRALPDVRDGLKPVHRRALFAMHELGNDWNRAYKKSARVVGNVIGKYHPHGDVAVYDTIVRMAQPFSLRYMLVDGQGNFGCFTGDTKIKLLDGTDKSFAELATLPPDTIFYVYAVNQQGLIVVGEGRHARITGRNVPLIELTLDNGEIICCTPDHRFMLRDGTYKEAQELTIDDSLMPGYFDTIPIKKGLNNYLRILQPLTGEYEFIHHLADAFNAQRSIARKFHGAFVRHHKNYNRFDNRPTNIERLGFLEHLHLLNKFSFFELTPLIYDENRKQNWIPRFEKALKYFSSFDQMIEAGGNYNHRIISRQWLTRTADTYDITVDEHHNFLLAAGVFVHNSVDGDPAAAMRYTEIRMSRIAHELLADIEKETVDFVPNYDESEHEPTVLPTRVPNLLVNGSSGIAVGMATNIPPHNLGEVIDACVALVDNSECTLTDLMRYLPGPDFPTAAFINGSAGIREAYATGRGRIYMRARTQIEDADKGGGKQAIIVTELPYQVNKARLLEKIADLVKERHIEGITALRDESDKDGMRMVIELRRGEVPEVVLNNLYQHTQMQSVFGINMVALVDGQPHTLSLKQIISAFLRHRREVVTRRTIFELRKARERAHLLEGLAVALVNIDPIIALIKVAANPAEAKSVLLASPWPLGAVVNMLERSGGNVSRPQGLSAELGLSPAGYQLSEAQAQAILDLRLHRLTGLEQDKILEEYRQLLEIIVELLAILGSKERLMAVIREELLAIRTQFADPRRTEILIDQQDLTMEDLITAEDVVVTFSHTGYAKYQSLSLYRAQRRGGKGRAAANVKEEDFIDKLFIANTHDTLMCFSSRGKVYWVKVHQLPQAGPGGRGKPIVNLLPLEGDERINAILPVRAYTDGKYVFMATQQGVVKKIPLIELSRPRPSGLIAVGLRDGDHLIGVELTDGTREIMLFASDGKAVRFSEEDVRPMGRDATGVRGITLQEGSQVIALMVAGPGCVLTVTENGYGKRTSIEEYRLQGRGGQGVISIQTSERNGPVVGAVLVQDDDEIMLITNGGTLVRTPVAGVSHVGRNTQGVKLIAISDDERLAGIERIAEQDEAAV